MTGKQKRVLIIIAISFLALLTVIFFIRNSHAVLSILKPFIMGIIIAYVFNPVVSLIVRRGVSRIAAVIIVYSLILGVIVGILSFVIPSVYRETMRLMDILPSYAFRTKDYLDSAYLRFSKALTPELKEAIRDNIDYIQEMLIYHISRLTDKLLAFFGGLANWIIALVISFYLLKDKDYFMGLAEYMIPVRMRQGASKVCGDINKILTGFIRGQLLIALVIAILATIGFLLIDMNFAILMGIITGIANIIPYFGPILGGIPVAVVGLMESPSKALWAVVVVLVIQQLESGVITPKIIGDSVGIHPVFIILSLFIAARFYGLAGLIFAVPVAAIIKILAVHVFDKIVNSS